MRQLLSFPGLVHVGWDRGGLQPSSLASLEEETAVCLVPGVTLETGEPSHHLGARRKAICPPGPEACLSAEASQEGPTNWPTNQKQRNHPQAFRWREPGARRGYEPSGREPALCRPDPLYSNGSGEQPTGFQRERRASGGSCNDAPVSGWRRDCQRADLLGETVVSER